MPEFVARRRQRFLRPTGDVYEAGDKVRDGHPKNDLSKRALVRRTDDCVAYGTGTSQVVFDIGYPPQSYIMTPRPRARCLQYYYQDQRVLGTHP